MRAVVAAGRAPDVDAIFGISRPRWPWSSAPAAAAARSTVRRSPRFITSCGAYLKLGTQYCPDCDLAIEPQSAASIVRAPLRDYRGQAHPLLAPLHVARNGLLQRSGEWAAKKGFRTLRAMARRCGRCRGRGLSRFPRAHHRVAGCANRCRPQDRTPLRDSPRLPFSCKPCRSTWGRVRRRGLRSEATSICATGNLDGCARGSATGAATAPSAAPRHRRAAS